MRWFKHDTDGELSEGLNFLLSVEGFAGYGRWFRLLEIVAIKMDGSDRCHAEYPVSKWCSLLGLKRKKLNSFLELTENKLKTKVVCSENVIKIEIPNLLKKRDEYSEKSRHKTDNVPNKNKEIRNKSKEERIKKGTKIFIVPSVEEIKSYCEQRGNRIDAEYFFDSYESKGWMVGKNKMKDWKASIRTWEKSNYGGQANGNGRGIRTSRSDPGDKTLQSRQDADIERILADYEKASAADKAKRTSQ